MTKLTLIILLGLITVISSCNNRIGVDQEIDKTVMKEIFPALLDSMFFEIMFLMRPAPIEKIFDSVSGNSQLRPSEKTELFKEQIRNELTELKNDSTAITIVINDTIHPLDEDEKRKFQSNHVLSESFFNRSYNVDLNTKKQSTDFTIILSSTYKTKPKPDPVKIVLKVVSFSRIVFNQEQNKGMLTCEYICGGHCGNGFRIFIKQVSGQWTVDYIGHTWVA